MGPFHFLPGFTQDFYTGVPVTTGECLNIVTFQVQTSNEQHDNLCLIIWASGTYNFPLRLQETHMMPTALFVLKRSSAYWLVPFRVRGLSLLIFLSASPCAAWGKHIPDPSDYVSSVSYFYVPSYFPVVPAQATLSFLSLLSALTLTYCAGVVQYRILSLYRDFRGRYRPLLLLRSHTSY